MYEKLKVSSILIVDDTVNNLRVLEDILEPVGYKLYFATKGLKAIEIASQQKPDLILLDILMPDMNGYEVCEKLKKDVFTRHIPVIFVSALHATDEKVKALEVGGVDFVTKPFDPIEIKARIASNLTRVNSLLEFDNLLKLTHHELNTPLCIIDTAVSLQKRVSGDSKYLDSIKSASKTLHNIYKDLYFFLQEKQYNLEKESTKLDLFSILQGRVEYFDIIAKTNGVAISLSIKDESPAIAISIMEAERFFDNLISNAIRYAKKNTQIEITVSKKYDSLITIRNSVAQGDKKSDYEPSITGLGFDIIRTICKHNNMSISFNIKNNVATTIVSYRSNL